MGDTIEVVYGLDSDSTTGFNIFQHFSAFIGGSIEHKKYKTNGGHMDI